MVGFQPPTNRPASWRVTDRAIRPLELMTRSEFIRPYSGKHQTALLRLKLVSDSPKRDRHSALSKAKTDFALAVPGSAFPMSPTRPSPPKERAPASGKLTLGGISGCTIRTTTPSASSWRSWRVRSLPRPSHMRLGGFLESLSLHSAFAARRRGRFEPFRYAQRASRQERRISLQD